MIRRAPLLFLTSALLALMGCSSVKTSVGPDGTHRIRCGNGMTACITEAAKICEDDGYTIERGVSRPKLLGGPSSPYRTKSELAEIDVRCGLPEEGEEETVKFKLPPRTDEAIEPVPSEQPPVTAPAPAARVCTPGATQTCVGPGACQGGQVCLDGGQGFGRCDCGDAPSKKSSEGATGAAKSGGDGPSSLKPGAPSAEAGPVPGAAPAPTPLTK